MRTSQIHIIAMLAAMSALAASCSQDDTADSAMQEIKFLTEADTQLTRSSLTLPTDYVIWVQAVYYNPYTDNYVKFFPQEQEFIADASGIWSHNGDPLYYPASGTIDFMAYAVSNASHKPTATYSPTVFTTENNTFSTLTLDFGTKLDGTDAVVVSDLCDAVPCGRSTAVQNLHFRNAMAKIVFKACTEDVPTQERFIINQLTIRDVKTSGVLKATPHSTVLVEGVSTGSTVEWTSISNNTSISLLPTNAKQGVNLTATDIGNPVYLPRQSNTPLDIEMELTYSYQPSSGPSFGPEKITITLKETNWLPGQQYTYTLTCNIKQIKVECQSTGAIVDSTPEIINLDELYHGKNPV